MGKGSLVLAILLIFTLLASCSTAIEREGFPNLGSRLSAGAQAPGYPDGRALGRFDRLGEGALIYAWADLAQTRALIEPFFGLMPGLDVSVLSRGKEAVFAMYPKDERGEGSFVVDAEGSWPSFRLGLSLGFSRDWKKKRDEQGAYWSSSDMTLRFDKRYILASNKQKLPSYHPIPLPGVVADLPASCDLVLWIDDPSRAFAQGSDANFAVGLLTSRLGSMVVTIDVTMDVQNESSYVIRVILPFHSEREARAVASLLRLALRALPAISGPGALDPGSDEGLDSLSLLLSVFAETEVYLDGSMIFLESVRDVEFITSLLLPSVSVYFRR